MRQRFAPREESRSMATDANEEATIAESTRLAPPTAPPASGEFDKYELLGELGRGGMGVVYRARQRDLDRIVALKMILSHQFASEEQILRFHAEARAAARLPHPHIIQVFETGQLHGQPYFAMELVEGQSLECLLHHQPLSPEKAVAILHPIARAVGHLHKNQLIHRDLKPGNILVDASGRPVLTDFGLAKMLAGSESHLTNTGAILGTPSYMSPEQAQGLAVGPQTDVYALGAILYECLTGRPPFRAATPLDTIIQVVEREPTLVRQLNPGIPRNLELICLKCLEKDPQERYATATELADDLEHFLEGESVVAQPESLAQRFERWCRRQPGLASHLGAISLGLVMHEIGYAAHGTMPPSAHHVVLIALVVWGLLSVVWQKLLHNPAWESRAETAWSVTDVSLLTLILAVADGFNSPLVVLYPLYIGASGLWWKVRLVWLSTALSQLGYAGLLVWTWWHQRPVGLLHRHVILIAGLAILGYIVAYQVQRIRLLSRHLEQRP